MKFIIAIKDKYGNTISEREENAEPQYISLTDTYEFLFDSFHMMIDRKLLVELMVRENDQRR